MTKSKERKAIAKDKMHIAIENLRQAELEGADKLAPVTYKWAKSKIYEDRKIILDSQASEKEIEEAADDASAASAQLLSTVRRRESHEDQDLMSTPEVFEKTEIDVLINEGGPVR